MALPWLQRHLKRPIYRWLKHIIIPLFGAGSSLTSHQSVGKKPSVRRSWAKTGTLGPPGGRTGMLAFTTAKASFISAVMSDFCLKSEQTATLPQLVIEGATLLSYRFCSIFKSLEELLRRMCPSLIPGKSSPVGSS